MSVKYLTPASQGGILFNEGPLCAGLISTLLSLVGSRHSHTLPLVFGIDKSCCTTLISHPHPE